MSEELLKILDMNEDEQRKWLRNIFSDMPYREWYRTSLADLAFRLRDEARTESIEKWDNAIHIVASHINESPMPKDIYPTKIEVQWSQIIILNQSEYPVYMCWIITALIAKGEQK